MFAEAFNRLLQQNRRKADIGQGSNIRKLVAKPTLAKEAMEVATPNVSATLVGLCGLEGSPKPSRDAEQGLVEVRG